ncbi:MAG: extracellular solute-binding protein [Streptosporangiales bacterium]|nr:extracellular solute-binding protein [Streptosporangiales bacterium]
MQDGLAARQGRIRWPAVVAHPRLPRRPETMTAMSRRRFLALSGAVAAAAVTGACGGGGGGGGASRSLTWWDHQNQLEQAKEAIFTKFAKAKGGVPVQYTYYNPQKMGQALQLAKQSDQLPDVHSNAGLLLQSAALVDGGWAQPLDLSVEAAERLKGSLVDGVHVFDGKTYAFPIFSHQVYVTVNWFNTKLVEKAGLDPDAPPETYDEFRAAARAVQDKAGDNTYGWVWNIGMPDRMTAQVDYLAQAAGFEGGGEGYHEGRLYRTGEFAFHADEYVDAIEFLVSLSKDKLVVPGANSWIDDVARARWTAGASAYYFDGPWCPGVALKDTPDFGKSLGVGPILRPNAGSPLALYHRQQLGDYWLSPGAKNVEAANALLSDYFTTPEYSVQVANTMSQPPRDIEVVEKSSAHPAYKKLIGWFRESVFAAPEPIIGNPDVQKVEIEGKRVTPTLGDITQGALTGDITDVRGALKKLSDASSKERERAVAAAKKKGAEVELDDYAFPNWKPGADYTKQMYAQR